MFQKCRTCPNYFCTSSFLLLFLHPHIWTLKNFAFSFSISLCNLLLIIEVIRSQKGESLCETSPRGIFIYIFLWQLGPTTGNAVFEHIQYCHAFPFTREPMSYTESPCLSTLDSRNAVYLHIQYNLVFSFHTRIRKYRVSAHKAIADNAVHAASPKN